VPHTPTDRYKIARDREHREFSEEISRTKGTAQAETVLACIQPHFPRFAALLGNRSDLIIEIERGATVAELGELENSLGIEIPGKLKVLLACSSRIHLEGLCIGNVFFHTARGAAGPSEGMLCFADYWLDGDGDQVLFDPRDLPADDPPVYYYNHDAPLVRPLAGRFSDWLESLDTSPLFRD
jgi:hypothetical protein